MYFRSPSLIALLALSGALPPFYEINSASASPLSLSIYGHQIEVHRAADGQEQLAVDKKVFHKDQYITLDQIETIDGVLIAIGHASPGGNACDGSLFVLSFPKKKPVRIDGPLESCSPGTVHVEQNRITVEVAATPELQGSRWRWSAVSGFSAPEKIEFTAKADGGWSALRSQSIDHPSQVLNYADLSKLVDDRLGSRSSFVRISSGPGSAHYRSNLLIASSCQAHSCDDTALLLVADPANERIFVALKDKQTPILVNPKASDWPSGSTADLVAFQRKWQR